MLRLSRGNPREQTPLYAGNPEYPAVLVRCHTRVIGCGMSSENPTGADNQQERLGSTAWLGAIPYDLGHYVAGFVDGEGCFYDLRRSQRGMPTRLACPA